MRISAKTFSIRSGHCTVYRDRMEIYQNDLSGRVGKWLFKRNIYSAAPFYLLLAFLLFLAGLLSLSIQNYFLLAFLCLAAVLALALFYQNRRRSFVPIIRREQIESLTYREAVPGKARPSFEVLFMPQPEKKPKLKLLRQIVLPNSIQKGTRVADTAYWILKDEGMLTDPQD